MATPDFLSLATYLVSDYPCEDDAFKRLDVMVKHLSTEHGEGHLLACSKTLGGGDGDWHLLNDSVTRKVNIDTVLTQQQNESVALVMYQ